MPLQKQVVPINFNGGLDQKTDPKTVNGMGGSSAQGRVIPAKLLLLENGVFQKANRISKRHGYGVLSQNVENVTAGVISSGSALGVYNNELNLFSKNTFYSYTEAVDKWIQKGAVNSVTLMAKVVVADNADKANPSVDTNSGISVYAYQEGRAGTAIYYAVIDQVTGAQIVPSTLLATNMVNPYVVAFKNSFYIFYGDSGATKNLYYRQININTPSTIGTQTNFTGNLAASSSKRFDATVVGDKLWVAYHNDTAGVSVRSLSPANVISSATTVAVDAANAVGVWSDDAQNLWVGCCTSSAVSYFVLNYLGVQIGGAAVETIAASAITGAVIGTQAQIYYEIPASFAPENYYIKQAFATTGAVLGPPSVFNRSVALAGKAFIFNGDVHLATVHESDLQATYFIFSYIDGVSTQVIAKITPNNAGQINTNSMLTRVPLLLNGNYLFAGGIKTQLQSTSAGVFSVIGVNSTEIDFSSSSRYQNAQMGELYIAGGFLQSYDGGYRVVEDNFHLFPEDVGSITATTGGSIGPGTYQYSACYEWTDNLGQIHRSAPSIPVTQVVPAGTSTNANTVTVPTLRITAKINVSIILYRTEDGGSIFYRTSGFNPVDNANNPAVDSFTFIDTTSDAALIARATLYTTGGVLENIAAPSMSLITTYRNRIIGAGLEDPLAFVYSKLRINGTPVEFTDSFIGRIDPRGGAITAIGALDNYTVFFKEKSIFVFTGNGPNDTGTQSDYQDPELISTDVGCKDPNSVVITPDGLMFKSEKGICLLNRSLQTSYIGADVEDYNDLNISASQLIAAVNQVRFTTTTGVCLVYDYFFGQWYVFTNHVSEDCALWQGDFVFLKSSGQVWVENDGYMDNGAAIVLSLATAWMSFAGLQGYERIYRMIILGEYKSEHKLSVEIGYDFNPNYEQFAMIDVNSIYPGSVYGGDSPYGSGTPYGGDYPLYQFKTHMTRQKCQAVRFKFSDNQNAVTGNYGEGFNITNMALEVGLKAGTNKIKIANNFATSGG